MQEPTETPIDIVDSDSYKAALLTSFTSKSKYLQLWQELKHSKQLTLPLNPKMYKHHKQYRDSLGLLYKQDLAYKEFCLLDYGEPMLFYSRHDKEKNIITIKLLSSKEYKQQISNDCKALNKKRFD